MLRDRGPSDETTVKNMPLPRLKPLRSRRWGLTQLVEAPSVALNLNGIEWNRTEFDQM